MTPIGPNAENPFFLYDPSDNNFLWFPTAEARDEAAKKLIAEFCEDGEWFPEVENLFCGKVTHKATQVDRVDRPPEADLEDGTDGTGRHWPEDCEFMCRYEMKELTP